jgi:integrase
MPGRITDATVRTLRNGGSLRDTELRGFAARRHKSGRVVFYIYKEGRRPLYRVIGGGDVLSASKAREFARKVLAKHVLDDAEPLASKGFTIARAWPLWRAHLERMGRSPGTLGVYKTNIERIPATIQKKLFHILADDPSIITEWHTTCAAKTPSAADASARTLASLYRWVAKRHDRSLPAAPPTVDLNLAERPPAKPRRVLLPEDARDWWKRVKEIRDPVRREAHLFLLLSGLRVDSMCQATWNDLHRNAPMTLHIAKPKGGAKRAFDLPLSEPMLNCLKRVLHYCGERGRLNKARHIFVRRDCEGPLTGLSDDSRATWFRAHALRRGYASFAKAADVDETDISRLLNHRVGVAVTSRYIKAVLLPAQERISAAILEAIGDPALDSTSSV